MRAAAADLPSVTLPATELQRLCSGQTVAHSGHVDSGLIAVLDGAGGLAALARAAPGVLAPERVIVPS